MLKRYMHGVNNINEAKKIGNTDYDGIESDFHLIKDGNFVAHHDYSVEGLNNHLRFMNELQLSEFRGDGTLENLHTFISVIGNKKIIIDLKSWQIIKTAYPDTEEYAKLFLETMKPYYGNKNISFQSYDQELLAHVAKLSSEYHTGFKAGIIVRSRSQLKRAITLSKTADIKFFSIRQKIINLVTVKEIKRLVPNIEIISWVEKWEQQMSDPKIAEESGCDGIIYGDGRIETKELVS
jgi:glycerophosphoryl diester phosphodiesterase